jgi:N-acetylneuraminate synthase
MQTPIDPPSGPVRQPLIEAAMREPIATSPAIIIAGRKIGPGEPAYLIAELSANHRQDFAVAEALVRAAATAGADAVKLQTYTADTLTLDCEADCFRIGAGTAWEGKTLHELYQEAFMPWEWQPRLKALAEKLGMACFSTPFDFTAVDFLENMGVPAHKIASFELVDIPLIRRVAACGKPVIISTGMAELPEITEAVQAVHDAGNYQLALLKCTSAYPAKPETMNLRAIPDLAARFGVIAGLSDHSLDPSVPAMAVALGAAIIEKHLTLSRATGGPDSSFSLEPDEFRTMAEAIRRTEATLGAAVCHPASEEEACRIFRRSLFVVKNIRKGEVFTPENLRSIRPAHGLHPRHYDEVLGQTAARDIARGTPLNWDLVASAPPATTQ